jgi:hypothetical protein
MLATLTLMVVPCVKNYASIQFHKLTQFLVRNAKQQHGSSANLEASVLTAMLMSQWNHVYSTGPVFYLTTHIIHCVTRVGRQRKARRYSNFPRVGFHVFQSGVLQLTLGAQPPC